LVIDLGCVAGAVVDDVTSHYGTIDCAADYESAIGILIFKSAPKQSYSMSYSPHPDFAPHPQRYNSYPDIRHDRDSTFALVEHRAEPVAIRRFQEETGHSTQIVPYDQTVVDRNDAHYESYSSPTRQTTMLGRDYSNNSDDNCSSSLTPFVEPLPPQPRYFRGRPVKPKNQHLPDHVLEFKERRKLRTAAAAWTGGFVGFVSTGPIGAAVGATAAYGIAKGVGKARERRLIAKSRVYDLAGGGEYDLAANTPPPNTAVHKAVLA
jgi:hypothetical protein